MLVSYNWLKEYVNLDQLTPAELADKITLTGIEVEDVISQGGNLTKIVVGEVLTEEKMEGSDHLHITTVNVGEEEPYQIVCGAPNVAAGQKVIVALPGARLAGGLKIKKSKLRGHVSNGMICSLQELGFSDSVIPKKFADGIYVLPEDAEPGEEVRSYLGMDDVVLDLSITPNRADALSMRGVAYEVGAILNQTPSFPELELKETSDKQAGDLVSVAVEDEKDAPVYKMRIIEGVTVKESPLWLQQKLMKAGIRPIDNLVDITNYVMLVYGQPLHAFDYDKLGSKEILVRRAKEDEKLVTLDGTERTLSPENLVITNGSEPIALAGVMGGENSHITDTTTTVALEAALFESTLIRKTAQQLNLRSESSSRFEKGINVAAIQQAADHAAALMAELGGGRVVEGTVSQEAIQPEDTRIHITVEKINRSLGTKLTEKEVTEIIERLGFGSKQITDGELEVSVPPRRWDMSIQADVVEEVARIYGYNRIPATLPSGDTTPGELSDAQRLDRHTRRFLEGSGLSQAITYSLTTTEKANRFALRDTPDTHLDWPMSEEHKTLRKSLISGLLDSAGYNRARSMKDVALYETGRVFFQEEGQVLLAEEEHVAAVLTGSLEQDSWLGDGAQVDFFTVKGILEELFASYGLKEAIVFKADSTQDGMHPGRTAAIELNGKTIGFVGQIHPLAAKEHDLDETYVFEFNLDAVVEAEKEPLRYSAIPKYPGTSRDIALLVDEEVTHQQVLTVIEENGGKWLREIRLFDLYQGESIQEGKKSLAYSLAYLNPEATLVEEDVNKAFEKVKEALVSQLNVEIR